MRKIYLTILLGTCLAVLSSCQLSQESSKSSTSQNSNITSSTISSNIDSANSESFMINDLSSSIFCGGGKTINEFFINDDSQMMITLQQIDSKSSIVSLHNLTEHKTKKSYAVPKYVAKIKQTTKAIFLFCQDEIIKLSPELEYINSYPIPVNAYSVQKMDISSNGELLVFADRELTGIYTASLADSGLELLLETQSISGAAFFTEVIFANEDIIFFSYRTEDGLSAFGLYQCNNALCVTKTSENIIPKTIGHTLLLYQSMENFGSGSLYLYRLSPFDGIDNSVAVPTGNPMETACTTMSSNANYILTAFTNETVDTINLNIYNVESKKATSIEIPDEYIDGSVNLSFSSNNYFISNDGETICFSFHDDSGAKMLYIKFRSQK